MKLPLITFLILFIITYQSDYEIDLTNVNNRKIGYEEYFNKESNELNIDKNDYSPDLCEKRPNPLDPNYFYIIPIIKAKLYKESQSIEFKSRCFKKVTATIKIFSKKLLEINLHTKEKKSLLCTDTFLIHTTNINKIVSILTVGNHKIKI